MKKIFVLISIFIIAGCAGRVSQGNVFQPHNTIEEGYAIAYFINKFDNKSRLCLLVGIDNNYEGCVGPVGYTSFSVKPGTHKVSFTPDSLIKIANTKFDFEFEEGNAYYFEFAVYKGSENTDSVQTKFYNSLLRQSYAWYLREEEYALKQLEGLREWE